MPGESLPFESITQRRRAEEIAIYHAHMRLAKEREAKKTANLKPAPQSLIDQLENNPK